MRLSNTVLYLNIEEINCVCSAGSSPTSHQITPLLLGVCHFWAGYTPSSRSTDQSESALSKVIAFTYVETCRRVQFAEMKYLVQIF